MPTNKVIEEHESCRIVMDMKPSVGISRNKCIVCKGRIMCGISPCPILSSISIDFRENVDNKWSLQGRASGVNVGWEKFPSGSIVPTILDNEYDPSIKFDNIRESIYYKISNIYGPCIEGSHIDRYENELSKIALSQDPIELDVSFSGRPERRFFFSTVERAYANSGPIEALEVFGEPNIPLFFIDILERNMAYEQAIIEAYRNDAEIEYISKLLSMGCFGKTQKFMPSRWAKTTVYSVCSHHMIKNIKKLPIGQQTSLYHHRHLGNDYVVLAFPRAWEFELLERWLPNCIWTMGEDTPLYLHEHETYNGVSDQAMREGGSYYSSRLGVCELLKREGMQSACLVISSANPGSSIPFGSGETRMGVSGAELIDRYDDEGEALEEACSIIGMPKKTLFRNSMLLSQNTLGRWL
ncbi:MAG: hypothetical protein JW825_02050 [Candidatus Methanofastidiosa archaeon]|nr:hypothetical protein [Candidatus Methanofastidiosa archaeon]